MWIREPILAAERVPGVLNESRQNEKLVATNHQPFSIRLFALPRAGD